MVAIYSQESLDRNFFGWIMPPSFVQSINPIFIIIFAGVFAGLWTKLGSRQPGTPLKFSLGLVFMGLAFCCSSDHRSISTSAALADRVESVDRLDADHAQNVSEGQRPVLGPPSWQAQDMEEHESFSRRAVDVIGGWSDSPDRVEFMGARVGPYLAEPYGHLKLIVGLVHVANCLLTKLEAETGMGRHDILEDCARDSG